jgi:methionine-rich copper-binding protein CopC
MIRVRACAALLLAVALISPTFQAAAHTTLESSSPPSGATLDESPAVIEMKFHHPLNLTSVVAVDAVKAERKLDFTPHSSAAVFQLTKPQLHPGKNEIIWKGLSKDGHVVTGTLVYEIKAQAAKTP